MRGGAILFGAAAALLLGALVGVGPARAERISDVRHTKHNLALTGEGEARASGVDEVCVFCHTPHGANEQAPTPLWNRSLSGATYIPYESSSLDAIGLGQPGGTSKLCLSCHDGTIALGSVLVLGGRRSDQDVAMFGTAEAGAMPEGAGRSTGFTRRLGTNLTNDHPISFTYDDSLAMADGELRLPSLTDEIANREPRLHPAVPLVDDQLQCTACHDPHIRDTVEQESIKFLRLHRLQQAEPFAGGFDERRDMICLACHDKEGWVGSAHANSAVAEENYASAAGDLREFPPALPVWRAGCLNCHDPHTVEGARRLVREGTDSLARPKQGGRSAIEETCYQCHSSTGEVLRGQGSGGFDVPDIRIDFMSLRHMPIDEQPETHDIGTGSEPQPGKDFLESQALLGKGDDGNRHAECTDCHNPHRVIKNRLFNGLPGIPDAAGTHDRTDGVLPTNIASGVLRGAWGVEPIYGSTEFLIPPIDFVVKRGVPPIGGGEAASNPWLTREYQLCFKCHSEYAYDEPPLLGLSFGGTPPGTNSVNQYTDQAMEFQAPEGDKGEPGGNHRSWHPVMDVTGRPPVVRQADAANWLAPFDNFVGEQTMYCSDCHGSETAAGTIVPAGGENGRSWGPHGSNNDFILKGGFSQATGSPGTQGDICFKCHRYDIYAQETDAGKDANSGFGGDKAENLHWFHADKIDKPLQCSWCHVAVPHGWKNKALLVNLNDVGQEGGQPVGTEIPDAQLGFTAGPYYLNSRLKVVTFATSGNWEDNNCGSLSGKKGKDWMKDNCENPP